MNSRKKLKKSIEEEYRKDWKLIFGGGITGKYFQNISHIIITSLVFISLVAMFIDCHVSACHVPWLSYSLRILAIGMQCRHAKYFVEPK